MEYQLIQPSLRKHYRNRDARDPPTTTFSTCISEAKLAIAHVNIRSIKKTKYPISMKSCMIIRSIIILSVNETHLDESYPDCHLHVPGCSVNHKDRNIYGGGVSLCIHSSLRIETVIPKYHRNLETLYTMLSLNSKPRAPFAKLLVGTAYRPPAVGVRFWEDLSEQLDHMQSATSHLLVLGDLNTNILKPTQTHHFSHL